MSDVYIGASDFAVGGGVDTWDGVYFSYRLNIGTQSFDSGIISDRAYLFILEDRITSSTVYALNLKRYNQNKEELEKLPVGLYGTTANRGWDWTSKTALCSIPNKLNSSKSALTNKSSTEAFYFDVWNDLVAKVYNLLRINSLKWDSSYLDIGATSMGATSRILTAARFNALVLNLKQLAELEIPTVYTGMPVLASYFNNIVEAIERVS